MSEEEAQSDGLLWHYTSVDAALKILESNEFHATNSLFVNDSSETRYVENILKSAIREEADAENLIKTYRELDNQLRKLTKGVYITSFCLHKFVYQHQYSDGILSMWRAYGNAQVALGFDKIRMENSFSSNEPNYLRFDSEPAKQEVIYTHEESYNSNSECKGLIQGLIDLLRSFSHKNSMKIKPYAKSLMFIKHDGFREEQEYRFVRMPISLPADIVDATGEMAETIKLSSEEVVVPDNAAPYVKMFEMKNERLPLKKIIIGPSPEQDQRAEFVWLKLMHELDIQDVEIVKSSIPYRPN